MTFSSDSERTTRHPTATARVLLPYAAFASLWILFSDGVVAALVQDRGLVTVISTLKGWAFVGVTTLLLGVLIRRFTADALHRESDLRAVMAQAADAIWFVGADGKFLYANSAACRLLGYSVEDLLRLKLSDTLSEASQADLPAHLTSLGETHSQRGVWEMKCADGRLLDVELTTQRMPDGRYMATGRDMSERLRMEQDLQESESRFRAVFEQAAVGVAIVSPEGAWLMVNQRLCDILGYSREVLVSLNIRDITFPDDLAADLAAIPRMLSGDLHTYVSEKRYLKQDRSLVWCHLTSVLIRHPDGRPKFFVTVTQDITARRDTEEQLRKIMLGVEQSPNSILITDLRGRIEYVNRAFVDCTG